ncbi:hypothetical protein ELE36_07155 [Pseudolysobacter antarcticus]|uniref:DUF883 family protein n=1 Tax=Pseudolysobacter antarcticus TaxID=2511995 RepID=A0A411HI13_9GAMM|nr:hypothetical protein [Pseudolysobacter antarcticus]QBB70159.1 hypothetical protein ELE36_07155 [Pseudolysobacter antarcticus]
MANLNNSAQSGKDALREVKEQLSRSAAEIADQVSTGVHAASDTLGDTAERVRQAAGATVDQAGAAIAATAEHTKTLAVNAAGQIHDFADRAGDASAQWATLLGKYARANPVLTLVLGTVGGVVLGRLLTPRPIVVEPRRRRKRADS